MINFITKKDRAFATRAARKYIEHYGAKAKMFVTIADEGSVAFGHTFKKGRLVAISSSNCILPQCGKTFRVRAVDYL